ARIQREKARQQGIRYLLAFVPGPLDVGRERQPGGARGGGAAVITRARHHAEGCALFPVATEKHIRRAAKRTTDQRTDRPPDRTDGPANRRAPARLRLFAEDRLAHLAAKVLARVTGNGREADVEGGHIPHPRTHLGEEGRIPADFGDPVAETREGVG